MCRFAGFLTDQACSLNWLETSAALMEGIIEHIGGKEKCAPRQMLYKHVPRELIEWPKAGFGIPISHWLRGPLRPWGKSLVYQNRLNAKSYFYPTQIRKKWVEHLAAQRNNTASLWAVLLYQSRLQKQ